MPQLILKTSPTINLTQELLPLIFDNPTDYAITWVSDCLVIEIKRFDYSLVDLAETITNYANEQLIDIHAFLTDQYSPSAIEVIRMLKLLPNPATKVYDKTTLYIDLLKVESITTLKKLVFKSHLNDTESLDLILRYIECNSNTCLTARVNHYHRNTITQKISKFKSITGFNPKNFLDAYLIYSLLKG